MKVNLGQEEIERLTTNSLLEHISSSKLDNLN